MSVAISRIDPDSFSDWPHLLALILDAFAFMDGKIDPPSSAHRLTPEGLREKARTETCYLATEHGRLLGCIFCKIEEESLYIGKLAVAPAAQGKGIGRQLLDRAEALAREHALPCLRLETRIELVGNHAVFNRWDFQKTAEKAHPGYDRATSIEMRKAL